MSAHAVVDDSCFHDGHLAVLLDELQQCLDQDFEIEHSTIESERAANADPEHETMPEPPRLQRFAEQR